MLKTGIYLLDQVCWIEKWEIHQKMMEVFLKTLPILS